MTTADSDSEQMLISLAARAKARRLACDLTQVELARRAQVSLGSLKRFEQTGAVALDSMLRIAAQLECLDEFSGLFSTREVPRVLLPAPPLRQRVRRRTAKGQPPD